MATNYKDRKYIEQREAWQRGDMLYLGGSGRVYHLPGRVRDDSIQSLCGSAVGRVGLWNVYTEREVQHRRLCETCAHLSPAHKAAEAVERA